MKTKKSILYITQTAVMLALLIVLQFVTASLGQLVTGSIVNLILLTSLFLIGFGSGLTIGLISPFLAFFLGIPGILPVVPFIAVGNAILVTVAWLVRKPMLASGTKNKAVSVAGLIAASAAKFLFLWIGLTKIALPLLGLTSGQMSKVTVMFAWPQMVTALIGSALALIIVNLLKNTRLTGRN